MNDLWTTAFERGWLGMAAMMLVTVALRVGGYWVIGRFTLTPRLDRALAALPGAIILSTALPLAVRGGIPGMVGAAAVAAIIAAGRHEFIAILAGLATVVALRALGL